MDLRFIPGKQHRPFLLQHCTDRNLSKRYSGAWLLSDYSPIMMCGDFFKGYCWTSFPSASGTLMDLIWGEFSDIQFNRPRMKE